MIGRFDSTGRLRAAGLVLLGATFAVGTLAGVAVSQIREPAPQQTDAGCRDDDRDHERRSPFDDLGLSAEQRTRIDAILERRRAEMDAFWEEQKPRMEQIADSTRAEIRAVLNDEQRAELDRRRAARRAEREREKAESGETRTDDGDRR
jgi:Spy/CpxP family protein refolding chaperone